MITRMVLGITIQSTHPPFLLNLGKSHLPWCYVHEYCTYARGAVTHCDGTFLGEARNIVIRTQHLLAVVCTHNIDCLPGSVVGRQAACCGVLAMQPVRAFVLA